MGICEVLIPLTNSPSVEVQGNSAAALGNLSSKGMFTNQWSQTVANHRQSGRGLCALQRSMEQARRRIACLSREILE